MGTVAVGSLRRVVVALRTGLSGRRWVSPPSAVLHAANA